jgi:hypothetical protein
VRRWSLAEPGARLRPRVLPALRACVAEVTGPEPAHLPNAQRRTSESAAVIPVIDRTTGLPGVPDAIRDLETGQVGGKIAISLPNRNDGSRRNHR